MSHQRSFFETLLVQVVCCIHVHVRRSSDSVAIDVFSYIGLKMKQFRRHFRKLRVSHRKHVEFYHCSITVVTVQDISLCNYFSGRGLVLDLIIFHQNLLFYHFATDNILRFLFEK